ncbi:MAG: alkaline phosphatase family protein [Nitrospira sp.]
MLATRTRFFVHKALLIYLILLVALAGPSDAGQKTLAAPMKPLATSVQTKSVILFVLEGIDRHSLKIEPMPTLKRLSEEGATTWSAQTVAPPLRLPAMASLLTGLPVSKHGITWNAFEFSRGYPRPPTLFDYLDLSGGLDSAIFFMDESLYQLAKPAPYTDYQICGLLRPECTPDRLVAYIRQYLKKASSGHGYGHAVLAPPHLLVVHLPAPERAGTAHGWTSKEYREAIRSVDHAMRAILDLFREHGLLAHTTIFVASLNGTTAEDPGTKAQGIPTRRSPLVPWIVSGTGIKIGHMIGQPVSILDTGATVMRTLAVDTHTDWDSRVVEEVFQNPPAVASEFTSQR